MGGSGIRFFMKRSNNFCEEVRRPRFVRFALGVLISAILLISYATFTPLIGKNEWRFFDFIAKSIFGGVVFILYVRWAYAVFMDKGK